MCYACRFTIHHYATLGRGLPVVDDTHPASHPKSTALGSANRLKLSVFQPRLKSLKFQSEKLHALNKNRPLPAILWTNILHCRYHQNDGNDNDDTFATTGYALYAAHLYQQFLTLYHTLYIPSRALLFKLARVPALLQ